MSAKLDADVNVTHEDQFKINSFATNNALLQDLKEEVELKKKSLQNLEDAEADAMMLEDTDRIPYQTGEVFIHLQMSDAITKLDEDKKELLKEIASLESQMDRYKGILADLKVQLYAKFGNNINLEAGDD